MKTQYTMPRPRKPKPELSTNVLMAAKNNFKSLKKEQALVMLQNQGVNIKPLGGKHVATLTSMVRKLYECNKVKGLYTRNYWRWKQKGIPKKSLFLPRPNQLLYEHWSNTFDRSDSQWRCLRLTVNISVQEAIGSHQENPSRSAFIASHELNAAQYDH